MLLKKSLFAGSAVVTAVALASAQNPADKQRGAATREAKC